MTLTHKYFVEFDPQHGGTTAEYATPTCFADLLEIVTENAAHYSAINITRLDYESGALVGHDDSTKDMTKRIAWALVDNYGGDVPSQYEWIMDAAGMGRPYDGSDDECDLRRETEGAV
tara:strand:+ start:440 stop:793 length:354 start_codon:yes stop_codon:yes gene_type:complete